MHGAGAGADQIHTATTTIWIRFADAGIAGGRWRTDILRWQQRTAKRQDRSQANPTKASEEGQWQPRDVRGDAGRTDNTIGDVEIMLYCDEDGCLTEEKKIPIDEIEFGEAKPGALERRAKKYAAMILSGPCDEFKPISVFGKRFEDDTYQVFDGHARIEAYRIAGKTEIPAKITLVDKHGHLIHCNK